MSKPLRIIVFLALSAYVGCEVVEAAPSKSAKKKPASVSSQSTTKIINGPNNLYSILVSGPVKTDMGTVWRKIDIKDKAGHVTNIENAADEPGCGYSLAEDNLWSPDGKYFIIYHDIYSGPNPQQDERLYVDCQNGITVGFGTVRGTSAGLSNCSDAWMKGKPHSLSVSEENGKNAEALPPH